MDDNDNPEHSIIKDLRSIGHTRDDKKNLGMDRDELFGLSVAERS
jgi:hypothetical protein